MIRIFHRSPIFVDYPSFISMEHKLFLDQMPHLLHALSNSRLDVSDNTDIEKRFSFIGQNKSIPALGLIKSLRQLIDNCSKCDKRFMKEGVSLHHRCTLSQIIEHIWSLCQPLMSVSLEESTLSEVLASIKVRLHRFSQKQFQSLESSFFIKNAKIKDCPSHTHEMTSSQPGSIEKIVVRSWPAYELDKEALTTIAWEEEISQAIQSGELRALCEKASPILKSFPPGLLPLIFSFIHQTTQAQ